MATIELPGAACEVKPSYSPVEAEHHRYDDFSFSSSVYCDRNNCEEVTSDALAKVIAQARMVKVQFRAVKLTPNGGYIQSANRL